MNVYILHKKTGKPIEIEALSYTEDAKKDKIYFHRTEEGSDNAAECTRSAIIAIDTRPKKQFESADAALERLRSSPSYEDHLKMELAFLEKRRAEKQNGRTDQST